MLKGISPLISPELLKVLAEMGHGDEIVLSDAHFPAYSQGVPVIRADGLRIAVLLDAILPLFELDTYVDSPLVMMAPVSGDSLNDEVITSYRLAIARHAPNSAEMVYIDRFAFYDRTKHASAIVVTGETAKYGNIILKKGVTVITSKPF